VHEPVLVRLERVDRAEERHEHLADARGRDAHMKSSNHMCAMQKRVERTMSRSQSVVAR
jgi:hypothetical protein